jgi:hypothetical protein
MLRRYFFDSIHRAEYNAPIANRRQQLRARRRQIGTNNFGFGEAK